MERAQLSPLDRVKHSFLRTRSDADPAVLKKRRLSDIFSNIRAASDTGGQDDYGTSNPSPEAKSEPRKSPLPLNRHMSLNNRGRSQPAPLYDSDVFSDGPALPVLSNPRSGDGFINPPPREAHSQIMSDRSAMDERAMQRRLMDMESSFVPDRSTFSIASPNSRVYNGGDVWTSPAKSPLRKAETTKESVYDDKPVQQQQYPRSAFSNSTSSQTPTTTHQTDAMSSSGLSIRQLLSSPTAAAAQRNRLRQSSKASQPSMEAAVDDQTSSKDAEGGVNVRETSISSNAGYAKKAQAGQHSSRSSVHSESASSEVAAGAEETGFDSPLNKRASHQSRELSRLPSFGSLASSISAGQGELVTGTSGKLATSGNLTLKNRDNLERLDEEKQKSQSPLTPRASAAPEAPTNTVLTQHIQNIHVPDTVRRNFTADKQKMEDGTTASVSRPRTNLTLKEQNSRIDKLGKENFDLKLKIHYLHQALQDRSDEGVKDMISKNAQLQADLVKSRKENQTLRRRVRELEKAANAQNNEGTAPRSHYDISEEDGGSSAHQGQLEEELFYLREQMRHLESHNEQIRQDLLTTEVEKRNLAGQVMQLTRTDDSRASDVSISAYQQLLDSEVSRREAAEAREKELLDEVTRLNAARSAAAAMKSVPSNINMRGMNSHDTISLSGTTMVDQLRMENSELQRALGAQTSMLTSRNKERERLQLEIEDLKLVHRRGEAPRSSAGDSLFDRSASRSNQRPTSRHSSTTRLTQLSDHDREQYETAQATLRDENAMLKMRSQDLQKEINSYKDSTELLEAELAELEARVDDDRLEAQNLIDQLEDMVDERQQELDQLRIDFEAGEKDASTLRRDNESMSERLGRLLGNAESTQATVENLRQDLNNANGSLESTERALREATAAKERLEVQAESSQNEISFLREEQETDKIKISELQSSLRTAKTDLRDEKDRLQELEDLESEASKAREESRRLKKTLTSKEIELASSNDQLEELDGSLRRALGVTDGTIQSLVSEVIKRQRDLQNTQRDLETTKQKHSEREKQVADRETLLESSGLEARRLAEQLTREKQARKHDQNTFEKWQRTLGADSSRQDKKKLAQLEQQFTDQLRERNDLLLSLWTRLSGLCDPALLADTDAATIDTITRDLPSAKKTMLTALESVETTLSMTRDHIRATEKELMRNYRALEVGLESRSKRLAQLEELAMASAPRPSASIDSAGSAEFTRMRQENKQLRKELKYMKQGSFAVPGLSTAQGDYERTAERDEQPPLSAVSMPPPSGESGFGNADPRLDGQGHQRARGRDRETSALQRHASSSQVLDTSTERHGITAANSTNAAAALGSKSVPGTLLPSEQVWFLRLRELQRRLKAEREGRELDRTGAVNRLEEQRAENEDLRKALERERQLSRLRYQSSRRIEHDDGSSRSVKGRDMVSDAGVNDSGTNALDAATRATSH